MSFEISSTTLFYKIQPSNGCKPRFEGGLRTFYEVGDEFTLDVDDFGYKKPPIICQRGFHACSSFMAGFRFYPRLPGNRYFKVRLKGTVVVWKDQVCGEGIEIVEEVQEHKVDLCCTKAMCLELIVQNTNSMLLMHCIPEFLKDEEVCLAAVSKNGFEIKSIPNTFRSYDICLAAVQYNGFLIQHVPQEIMYADYNATLLLAAVSSQPFALRYIPDELLTREICRAAVAQNHLVIRHVPSSLKEIDPFGWIFIK
jgi:hypothetical protein